MVSIFCLGTTGVDFKINDRNTGREAGRKASTLWQKWWFLPKFGTTGRNGYFHLLPNLVLYFFSSWQSFQAAANRANSLWANWILATESDDFMMSLMCSKVSGSFRKSSPGSETIIFGVVWKGTLIWFLLSLIIPQLSLLTLFVQYEDTFGKRSAQGIAWKPKSR